MALLTTGAAWVLTGTAVVVVVMGTAVVVVVTVGAAAPAGTWLEMGPGMMVPGAGPPAPAVPGEAPPAGAAPAVGLGTCMEGVGGAKQSAEGSGRVQGVPAVQPQAGRMRTA